MRKIYLLFLFIQTFAFSFSQDKLYHNSSKLDFGDGVIISYTTKESGDYVNQIFTIDAPKAGKYYLAAWVNSGMNKKGSLLNYQLLVNDVNAAAKMEAETSNSQTLELKDMQIDLTKGINTITIKTEKPYCPNVEFIKISLNKDKQAINSNKYDAYINELSSHTLPDNYEELKKEAIETELSEMQTKSYELDNPLGNYEHEMDVEYGYTYYHKFYLQGGTTYTFETTGTDVDPIMHLFKIDAPTQYSWSSDDDGSGFNSKIHETIPTGGSGYYYILIRKCDAPFSASGVCDFYFNNSLYKSNCAVSGSEVNCYTTSTATMNWFTANTFDSRLWLKDASGYLGNIVAQNDDWTVTSDFSWQLKSRIRASFTSGIRSAIVSCYDSFDPVDECDLYMNCLNSTIYNATYGNEIKQYPRLKAEDAIQSAPADGGYNCIAWSGGITYESIWPPVATSDWYVQGNPLASFDNFYGDTVRYSGAMAYTQTGATSSNSVVDLYKSGTEYVHAAVRKPGNNHPHGYDWESKPNSLMRTFHPRNSIGGSSAGEIENYYKPNSTLKSAVLLSESIARGNSVIENVELTASEKQYISELIGKLSLEQKNNLDSKYEKWKNTWKNPEIAIHSNPKMYAKSEEYTAFIKYCETLGKVSWPFIFDKFAQGDLYAINALTDLTLPDNMDILEQIKMRNKQKRTTESGAIIVRSYRINAMKYIKELLKATKEVKSTGDDGIIYSNSFEFNMYPNPASVNSNITFVLTLDAKVSVQVIDLSGKVLSFPVNNQFLTQGNYNFQLNIPEGYKGSCLVNLRINNNVNVKLLVVE